MNVRINPVPARPLGGQLRCGESGQSVIAMVVVLVVVIAVLFAMVDLGAEATSRARAQAVADLVSLAAVSSPEAAEVVAAQNGATIVSMSRDGDTVNITISARGRTATAAAEPNWDSAMGI